MLLISGTDDWRTAHSEGMIGLLELSGVENNHRSPALDDRKREIEEALVEQYGKLTRQDLRALPILSAYADYYKRFKKTYHVQLQMESIALKGKKLPNVSPLVDANFMAEVETGVLTAGHDVRKLQAPIVIDVSREGDRMIQLYGTDKAIRAGDMVMRDAKGISCSIIYGQDNRSPITPETDHVLYVTYAPRGLSAAVVKTHMDKIEAYVRIFSPKAVVENNHLLKA